MKQTKEELVKQIAVLERDKETIRAKDELMRKEVSEAFNSFGFKPYGNQREVVILSWFQIFKELGRLLEKQKRLEYITDFEELKITVRELQVSLKENKLN